MEKMGLSQEGKKEVKKGINRALDPFPIVIHSSFVFL